MKFTMTVDLDETTPDPAHELVRILRYWSTAINADDVAQARTVNVYDSRFEKVGQWQVEHTATEAQA